MYFALITSFKSTPDYTLNKLGLPHPATWANYYNVLVTNHLLVYLANSILVVIVAMVFYVIICCAAGLAFGKYHFRGRVILFSFVIFFQIFPQMVVASELYQLLAKMGLINTRAGLIIAWIAYFTPFGAYIMTTYFSTVPKELIESARMDGANVGHVLFNIMMPVAKPMIGTIGIIGTLAMWNELPFAMMIVQKQSLRTITLGITLLQGEYGLPVPVLSAAVIVSCIVPFVLYLFFQNQITMGATAGSVKG
jgi:ABC-type glycerol-3-phosphate transport system permease component